MIGMVEPVNDLQAATAGYFDEKCRLDIQTERMCFKVFSYVPRYVELIECHPGTTNQILSEIDRRGYVPAPSPYVLGLGIQYVEVFTKYRYIVGLDKNNLLCRKDGVECFLSLNQPAGNGDNLLSLATHQGVWIAAGWYYAVIKKESAS